MNQRTWIETINNYKIDELIQECLLIRKEIIKLPFSALRIRSFLCSQILIENDHFQFIKSKRVDPLIIKCLRSD